MNHVNFRFPPLFIASRLQQQSAGDANKPASSDNASGAWGGTDPFLLLLWQPRHSPCHWVSTACQGTVLTGKRVCQDGFIRNCNLYKRIFLSSTICGHYFCTLISKNFFCICLNLLRALHVHRSYMCFSLVLAPILKTTSLIQSSKTYYLLSLSPPQRLRKRKRSQRSPLTIIFPNCPIYLLLSLQPPLKTPRKPLRKRERSSRAIF